MPAQCNLKQNMCFSSKQSSLFSFFALPSGGKSKDAVVHCFQFSLSGLRRTTSATDPCWHPSCSPSSRYKESSFVKAFVLGLGLNNIIEHNIYTTLWFGSLCLSTSASMELFSCRRWRSGICANGKLLCLWSAKKIETVHEWCEPSLFNS